LYALSFQNVRNACCKFRFDQMRCIPVITPQSESPVRIRKALVAWLGFRHSGFSFRFQRLCFGPRIVCTGRCIKLSEWAVTHGIFNFGVLWEEFGTLMPANTSITVARCRDVLVTLTCRQCYAITCYHREIPPLVLITRTGGGGEPCKSFCLSTIRCLIMFHSSRNTFSRKADIFKANCFMFFRCSSFLVWHRPQLNLAIS
jgi:hypothetical protein